MAARNAIEENVPGRVPVFICNVCEFASHNERDLCEHVKTHTFASELEKLMSVSMGYVEESVNNYTALEEVDVPSSCSSKLESSFCNDRSSDSQPKPTSSTVGTNLKCWTDLSIQMLINLYKDYDEEMQRGVKKIVWEKIAQKMSDQGGFVTWQQCDTKWKGLVTHYKKVLKHNETSGNDRQYWQYYDAMNEILHRKLEINPEASCSSRRGLIVKKDKMITKTPETLPDGSSDDMTVNSLKTPTFESSFTKKRKSCSSGVEQRHKEKMVKHDEYLRLFGRFTTALEKLANKGDPKSGDLGGE